MAGCGARIEVYVERGFNYKAINVNCGNTSPDGTHWLCDDCERKEGHRDWRQEAEAAGERWEPLD